MPEIPLRSGITLYASAFLSGQPNRIGALEVLECNYMGVSSSKAGFLPRTGTGHINTRVNGAKQALGLSMTIYLSTGETLNFVGIRSISPLEGMPCL